MKKIASILLLSILFFNWLGYRFVASYLEGNANNRLEAQLDVSDYDATQLVSIKVPAEHLAYYNNSKQFERVDGEIEINGIQYKYVKKRLYNDSLEYLCIPNQDVMKLRTAKDEFFKLVNDLQLNGQNKKSSSHSNDNSKNLMADYYLLDDSFHLIPFVCPAEQTAGGGHSSILHCYIPVAEQPPERS